MFDLDDYESQYAAHYSRPSFETTIVRLRRERVLKSVRSHPHRRVLEVGCGLEPLFLAVEDAERFVVVEPAERFVQIARSHAEGRDGISVIQGFLESEVASLQGEQFDFIVVSSLLHEVQDPDALLAAVRALCGPETVVHLNVPNVYSFHRLLALEMGLITDLFEQSATEARFQRHTRFDRARLLEMLANAGFRVRESGTYFIKPFTHDQMQAMLDAGVVDQRVIDGLDRMVRHLPDMGCEVFADMVRA